MTMKKCILQVTTLIANYKADKSQTKKARRDARKIYKRCKKSAKSGANSYRLNKRELAYPYKTIKFLKKWARVEEKVDNVSDLACSDVVTLSW